MMITFYITLDNTHCSLFLCFINIHLFVLITDLVVLVVFFFLPLQLPLRLFCHIVIHYYHLITISTIKLLLPVGLGVNFDHSLPTEDTNNTNKYVLISYYSYLKVKYNL